MILQSNSPIRSDIQEESKTVVFRCFQSKPLLDRLRMNKPLSTVEDVGTTSYFQGKPASNPLVERQLILIRSDRAGGLEEPTVEPYSRVVLKDDVGEAVMDKKNADAPVPPRRHRGIAGRARRRRRHDQPPDFLVWIRGSGPCRRGPTPHRPRHGPPTSNPEAATQAAWRDTALLSIGELRTENAALQIRVDELTLALALINADNNQLRRELAAIRIERNTFRAEAMTA